MSHARVLSKLKDDDEIIEIANRIINEKINVRDIEDLTKNDTIEKKHKLKTKREDSNYVYLENELSEKLGTKIRIKNNKIEISFTNDRDLERIIEILKIQA